MGSRSSEVRARRLLPESVRHAARSSGLRTSSFWLVLAGLLIVGCGSSQRREADGPLIDLEAERAQAERPRGPRQLERAEVEQALAAGFGKFLQHVVVEPTFVSGKFQGFRIVELTPPAAWQGVDLRAGDVVLQVNGQPIERPEQAHAVFVGLKNADRVVVSFLRDGKPAELVVPIVDAGGSPAPAKGEAPRDL